jgi:hypothetical protein
MEALELGPVTVVYCRAVVERTVFHVSNATRVDWGRLLIEECFWR